MTQRERSMLLVVGTIGGFILLFLGFVGFQGLLEDLDAKDRQITGLQSEVSADETKVMVLTRNQANYRHWQAISLPADRKIAASRYHAFLQELCDRHFPNRENEPKKWQITGEGGASAAANRGMGANAPLSFTVTLTDALLPQLLAFLVEFHSADAPHLIRYMTITPAGSGTLLGVILKIEALSLATTGPERDMLPLATDIRVLTAELAAGLAPAAPGTPRGIWLISAMSWHGSHKLPVQRDYEKMIGKNIFTGLVPRTVAVAQSADRDVLKGVELTSLTANFINTEATLRNRFTNDYIRLRAEAPFDTFAIADAKGQQVLKGKVLAIDDRKVDMVLEMGNESRRCQMHPGDFVDQAWRDGKKLTEVELKALGVTLTSTAEKP